MITTPINIACQQLDITQRAARFYEEKGLISSVRMWSGRTYTREQYNRLAIIGRCRRAGLPLADIPAALAVYEGSETNFHVKRAMIGKLEKQLDRLVAQIDALKCEIAHLESL
ncbi:MerR family transcriptional regulator [Phenylobacterium montanum]